MKFVIDSKNTLDYDVVVVGGGTAGVFAAISASKSGAHMLLVEKSSALGGTITTSGVNFPGLFYAWGKQIIAGPCWEAIERCVKLGGAVLPEFNYKPAAHYIEQILVNKFVYRSVLFQMCAESGVEILTNSMISSVYETEDGVDLLTTCKDGLYHIRSKVLIDATGDANVVNLAGYKTIKSEVQQPATPQNHLSGYKFSNIDLEQLHNLYQVSDFPAQITENEIVYSLKINKFDVHIPCKDAETSIGKTKLESETMLLITKIYEFCRSIRGLENLTIDYYADETAVRETVRIIGEETVCANDYINGRHYDDSICYAFYPIDLHVMNGIKQTFFENDKVGEIPYGALIPKNSKRILCAGRCVSSDTDANSAIRVQAPCMAMGQAAGCAAAISAKQNVQIKDVPYPLLCKSLKNIGAIVPNK